MSIREHAVNQRARMATFEVPSGTNHLMPEPNALSTASEPFAEFLTNGVRRILDEQSAAPGEHSTPGSVLFEAASDASELSLFSSRKPKHLAAGVGSAMKNVLKGIGAGTTCMLLAPAVGAQHGGVAGMSAGVLAGGISMVVLPATGLITAAKQLVAVY